MALTVRRVEPSDYEAIHRIYQGERVVWGTLQVPYPSVETWRRALAEPRDGVYSLVACLNDEVVGQLTLDVFLTRPRRRHAGTIGMCVRDDCQGQGVGTALMQAVVDLADNWLNLQRLELTVFVDNEPAIRLYQRFGFKVEGRLVHYGYRAGEFVDVYTMARLRIG
mgnify:FL=1